MSFWSLEPVSDLRQCVEDGKSAKDTAAFLTRKHGLITRNACISKAKRENVVFHGDAWEHRRGERRINRARKATARVVGAKRTKGVPKPPTPPRSLSQADHEIPLEQRKSLLELDNHTCRWPCNFPGAADFYFCGAPEADLLEARPYCERHSQAAYSKPYNLSDEERDRRRRWANRLNSRMTA